MTAMFKQIAAITVKEFKVLLTDRRAFTGLFILPIAFILVMTTALQGVFNTGGSDNPIHLLVVNQDSGAIAAKTISDLSQDSGLVLVQSQNGQELTRSSAESLITNQNYFIAVIFPADFSSSILNAATHSTAAKATATFVVDPTVGKELLSPVTGLVNGYIEQEASLAQAPLQAMQGFDKMAAAAPAGQAALIHNLGVQYASLMTGSQTGATQSLGVSSETVPPAGYQATRVPTSAEQNVPGYTIYGVFVIITTISTGIFREKTEGTFRRLQAAPLSRTALLIGKMLPYYLINLIQIILMLGVGMVVFHIHLGDHPLALVPLALATAATATGLGLMLASLSKTQEQVSNLAMVLHIVLSAIGGLFIPIYVMPAFMQKLAQIVPQYWAMTGFQDVIVRGQGVVAVLPVIGTLAAFAFVFWAVAIWRFRFD